MSEAVFKFRTVEAYKFLGLDSHGNRLYEGIERLNDSRKFDRYARTTMNGFTAIKVMDHMVDMNEGDYVVYSDSLDCVIDVCSEKLFHAKYSLN